MSCARAPADCKPVSQYRGVHRASTRGADAVEVDTLVFKEPIEHAPSEGAVGAPTLEGQIDPLQIG